MINLHLEQYEGPLDLLLALIQKHKIDIFDIPISELTDQYIEYISAMEEYNMEISADFIAMASELAYIKSKMLLPSQPEDEDPRKVLVDALLEYSRAKAAAEFLQTQSEKYFDRFVKEPDELDKTETAYFRVHSIELLYEAMKELASRTPIEEHKVELFEKLKNEKYFTVEEKILFTLRFLFDEKPHLFDSLFEKAATKGEVIATFLALLSLVRSGRVEVTRSEDTKIYLILNKHPEVEA